MLNIIENNLESGSFIGLLVLFVCKQGMMACMFNKGENCIAAGRLFVEASIHDEFVHRVVSLMHLLRRFESGTVSRIIVSTVERARVNWIPPRKEPTWHGYTLFEKGGRHSPQCGGLSLSLISFVFHIHAWVG